MGRWSAALIAAAGLGVASFSQASTPAMPFEQAVYVTCQEAEAMAPERRVALVLQLADHAAARYGVRFRDHELVERELAAMIRAGCTMFPNATTFFIVSAAVRAEASKLGAQPKQLPQ